MSADSSGGEKGVIKLEELHTIITLKNKGQSNRRIEKATGIDRRTIAKYWSMHQEQLGQLENGDTRVAQEALTSAPRYDTSKRGPVKYSPEIDAAIDAILEEEGVKNDLLGTTHKQKLTNVQIHGRILELGFDIGLTTVGNHVASKRSKAREVFIRQQYEFGQRMEYDFGEIRLAIGGEVGTYHMAAICSPASGYRWADIYQDQSKDTFLDSYVRFFQFIGGVYRECVYDNMRNVVTRFIGKNERELNLDLLKMSMYYGFEINVTNCFSPEEKGSVESAVKFIRNKVFAIRYAFDTLDDARVYLNRRLAELNEGSGIEAEKSCLLPAKLPLEIARISLAVVDKYSFIRVNNNFYSVPEYLVGKQLTVKLYPGEVIAYAGLNEVARHERSRGHLEYVVDIFHYLDTLMRKPGRLRAR